MFYFLTVFALFVFILILRSDLAQLRKEFDRYKTRTDKALWELQESQYVDSSVEAKDQSALAEKPAEELTDDELAEELPEIELPETPPVVVQSRESKTMVQEAQEKKTQKTIAPPEPTMGELAAQKIIHYFKTGNTMVKVGTLILFFGVSFLVKLAMDNGLFPPSVRLVCSGIIGMLLLFYGWTKRLEKRKFALTLQGGGLGIFYITIFAAMKMYFFVPPAVGFLFLILFSFGGGYLAVLQDSRNLAIFSLVGGFAAPILASTGSGRYIILFSYYLILNLSVLFVAFKKNWRVLNLLAFIATYGVAIVWGVLDFQAEKYLSVQPFLIGFFLIYLAIPILFSRRSEDKYVDGTLTFGNPIITFGLQLGIVDSFEYGAAISSLCFGMTYLLLAKNFKDQFKVLSDSFLAIGVVFATLTIPLALDPEVTAGIYALEAAGVYWISVRQKRFLGRIFSSGLLAVSILFFLVGADSLGESLPFVNAHFFSSLFIIVGSYFYSWVNHTYKAVIPVDEQWSGKIAQYIGLVWLFFAFYYEWNHVFSSYIPFSLSYRHMGSYGFMLSMAAAAWLLYKLGKRFEFKDLVEHSMSYPVAVAIVCLSVFYNQRFHPSENGGFIFWPLALISLGLLLKKTEDLQLNAILLKFSHTVLSFVPVILLTHELESRVDLTKLGEGWWTASVLTPSLFYGLFIYHPVTKNRWPLVQLKDYYRRWILGPIVVLMSLIALVFAVKYAGSVKPLSFYLPILNPMELCQILTFILLGIWLKSFLDRIGIKNYSLIMGGISFIWLNSVLYRGIHHYSSLPYSFEIMFDSSLVQTMTSIYWSLIGISLILYATHKQIRWIWIAGATFMGSVAVKLFMIDLSHTNTVERVISFIVVGVIFVLIGYFSPIPVEKEETKKESI